MVETLYSELLRKVNKRIKEKKLHGTVRNLVRKMRYARRDTKELLLSFVKKAALQNKRMTVPKKVLTTINRKMRDREFEIFETKALRGYVKDHAVVNNYGDGDTIPGFAGLRLVNLLKPMLCYAQCSQ